MRHDLFRYFGRERLPGHLQIIVRLQVLPELRGGAEEECQA
jgi:hypothetical protein